MNSRKYFLSLYLILVVVSAIVVNQSEDPGEQKAALPSGEPVVLIFDDPFLDPEDEFEINNLHYLGSPDKRTTNDPTDMVDYAARLIDSLNVTDVHVIGRGAGGPVAIKFATDYAEHVESLQLISPKGIMELELLGGYNLNNAVYKAQLIFNKVVKYAIPHFGYWDSIERRIDRTELLKNTDQRLLRDQLKKVEVPVNIIFDPDLTSSELVAKEFVRIIPQSNYQKVNEEQSVKEFITDFIDKVEKNEAIRRLEANSERVKNALKPFDSSNAVQAEGKALVILFLIIILSTFVTEDLTCIGTGLMIARGLIGFYPGVIACLVGIFVGDILVYLSGKYLAASSLHKAPLKWFISEKDIKKSYQWFKAKGPAIIIASRFIPGSRFPTYFSAGAIRASFKMFILYFGVASLLWTPALVGLSVLLGNQMIDYFYLYQEYALWTLLGVLALLWVVFKIVIPAFTFKGRRLLYGKWMRLTNWEFWSPFAIYSIVFGYIISLWIRFRSITVFSASNPGIEDGGFINESKSRILSNIGASQSVALFKQFEPDSVHIHEPVMEFMSSNGLSFPIVLKPDQGERGKGVFIPKNEKELKKVLTGLKGSYIAQEYIGGLEYGVFYVRYPSQEHGEIFSITKKDYLYLEGDGVHNLEELILKDERAVCLAEYHIDHHIEDLYKVPEKGERIKLVELGTHARGSVFYDGSDLITVALTSEIDRISKSFDGFYFGRYDLKAPTEEDLKSGTNLKVIEVNGVTSESTNIYDPKHSFWFGVRTLCKQWKIAYEIGAEYKNMHPDFKLPTVRQLLSQLR